MVIQHQVLLRSPHSHGKQLVLPDIETCSYSLVCAKLHNIGYFMIKVPFDLKMIISQSPSRIWKNT